MVPLILFLFFFCTYSHSHFTKRLCWNQSCPEVHTHLLKCGGGRPWQERGGSVCWQSPGEFWIPGVCLLWLSGLPSPGSCVGFSVLAFFNPTKLADSSSVPFPNSTVTAGFLTQSRVWVEKQLSVQLPWEVPWEKARAQEGCALFPFKLFCFDVLFCSISMDKYWNLVGDCGKRWLGAGPWDVPSPSPSPSRAAALPCPGFSTCLWLVNTCLNLLSSPGSISFLVKISLGFEDSSRLFVASFTRGWEVTFWFNFRLAVIPKQARRSVVLTLLAGKLRGTWFPSTLRELLPQV